MPSAAAAQDLSFTRLHQTFGAEVKGMQWQMLVSQSIVDEIRTALHKYGVLVFRRANLDNDQHIEFSRQFGSLDDVKAHIKAGRAMRFPEQPEIFDVSNLDENGNVITDADPIRMASSKGNSLWHADMAYNSQRCAYSLVRAVELPPTGTGGDSEYLDSRKAYQDLPDKKKRQIETLVTHNSLFHNRKLAAPEIFANVEPLDSPMSLHRLVSLHEESGRKNLYITTYAHQFDNEETEESRPLMEELLAWVAKPEYKLTVRYEYNGDLVMWDNRAVLHRATGVGNYGGKYKRDMRRTTVKDEGSFGWGENRVGCSWQAGLSK